MQTHQHSRDTHVHTAAAAVHWLRILHNAAAFNELIRILLKFACATLWSERNVPISKKLLFHGPSRYRRDWSHHPPVSTVIVYECEQASFLQWQRAFGRVDIVWDSDIRGRGEDPRKTTFISVPLWKPGWPPFLCLSSCPSWWMLPPIKDVPEWAWSGFSKNRVFHVIKGSYLRFRFSIHCYWVFVPQLNIFILETLKLIYWLRTNVTGTSKVEVFSATLK